MQVAAGKALKECKGNFKVSNTKCQSSLAYAGESIWSQVKMPGYTAEVVVSISRL